MEIRGDIAELMSKCVGCGRCAEVCTSRPHGGCNPLEVMKGDLERAKGCLGCGLCNTVCEFTVPKKVMLYAACMVGGMTVPQIYRETGYNLPMSDMKDVPVPDYTKGAGAQLMPGCLVVSAAPYLEYATERALSFVGIQTERYEGGCCSYPVPFRGLTDEERDVLKRRAAEPLRGRKLYTICSGCADEMVASGIDAEHVVHILHRNLEHMRGLPGVKLKVAIQTGCGMRDQLYKFRDIAEACGCEIVDAEQGCCGKLIPRISGELMAERQESMKGADAIVVGCPSCFARYDQYPEGIPVLYVTELILLAMGDRSTMKLHRRPVPGISR